MTTNATSPSAASRAAGCLWRLIKLFIAIVLGIVLGVALYYGGLYAYWGILAPINSNSNAINTLEGELRRTRERWEAELMVRDERIRLLSEQLDKSRQRSDVLEDRLRTQLATQEEALRVQVASGQESLQRQITALGDQRQALAEAASSADRRAATLEENQKGQQEVLKAQQEELARLGEKQKSLETALADSGKKLSGDLVALQGDLEAEIAGLRQELGTLESEIAGPQTGLEQLRGQTLLLKAAAQVLRIRIRLIQNNPGGARTDLVLLDATLAAMGDLPGVEPDAVSSLRDQVAQMRLALDENPFVASEQLEVLWLAITDLITF